MTDAVAGSNSAIPARDGSGNDVGNRGQTGGLDGASQKLFPEVPPFVFAVLRLLVDGIAREATIQLHERMDSAWQSLQARV